jgi:hypothetical protein
MCRVSNFSIAVSLILALLFLVGADTVFAHDISGTITAQDRSAIIAANVKLLRHDSLMTWDFSDTSGRFVVAASDINTADDYLEISAIGYITKKIRINEFHDLGKLKIILEENPINLGSIVVESPKSIVTDGEYISGAIIADKARRAIISTNSTNSIKQPQAVRDGSAQSAKIRVNGTSPMYFINGAAMGDDPNHYGMFNIIASPNLSGLNFFAQGTSAKYESPSVIEFKTPRHFQNHFKDELNLSFIEGTNSTSFGTERFFVMTSIRKSFLDLLIKEAPFKSDRLTIPPTSFMDWFASAGIKISPKLILITDQYYSKDYLSYNLPGTKRNPTGLSIKQKTESQMVSIRLESINQKLNYRLALTTRTGTESYDVVPSLAGHNTTMQVNLKSNQRTSSGDAEINYLLGNKTITAGSTLNYISGRRLNLFQRNWNFQPPDAPSDNPYFYQPELDYLYGSVKITDTELDNATYFSVKGKLGKFDYVTGLRQSYFQKLKTRWNTDYRLSLGYDTGKAGTVSMAYGTFSESPVKRILEPYQVLVRASLNRLRPVATELWSINYIVGKIRLGAFTKQIECLPILTPDFGQVDIEHRLIGNGFLTMQSIGKLNSYGTDMTFDLAKFPNSKTDIEISYGYTRSRKEIDRISIPYELDAPHKINIDISYKLSGIISVGGNFYGRSGYPCARPVKYYDNRTPSRYSESYYRALITGMYSSRFPFNYQTSIYINLDWENSHFYLTILNLTNRKNPLISSADGYIYDNGILPSLGYSCKF